MAQARETESGACEGIKRAIWLDEAKVKSILWITGIISGLIMIGGRVYAIWGDWMLGIQISLVSGTVTAACYLILEIFD
ncbi:hypothetical protein [Limosilactobacillus allomucosae]|uniref:hypothetical protein n=1 Tax=Limosilactobacillus allomucosae TaxID=3142938 RepID=UPI0032641129